MKITKTNPIVTYGSKVAGILPGNFSEIYHFSKKATWDANTGKSSIQYLVDTEATGDDFAKSNLGLKGEFDITNKLFYEVWRDKVKQLREELTNAAIEHEAKPINPFANNDNTEPNPNKPTNTWRT